MDIQTLAAALAILGGKIKSAVSDLIGHFAVISDTEPENPNTMIWLQQSDDYIIVPSFGSDVTGEVGQTVAVKSVDGSGKPTEWELVNGGGPGPSGAALIVQLSASDSTTVSGVTVSVFNVWTGERVARKTYEGQPLTFVLPSNYRYKVEFGIWPGYMRPAPIVIDVHTEDTMLTAEYKHGELYAFRLNKNEADPFSNITYLEDNISFTSAHMDYATGHFNYGDWERAFFMPRPCMLKYDGTVDYYLDPNDYTKREDGTPSDVANINYPGNAMVEWGGNGTIYYKIEDDPDAASATVYITNIKRDDSYVCWSFINNQDIQVEHFYTPIYNGSLDAAGRLRSISGMSIMRSKTAQQELDAAAKNNIDGDILWHVETFSDIQLINLLLILIGKSTDTQATFGMGNNAGNAESYLIATGTMDTDGLFWGTNDNLHGVKVFGMENWWSNQWRRYAGHIYLNSKHYIKHTYGVADGSSEVGYNLTGAGYINTNATITGTSGGYISGVTIAQNAILPKTLSGSTTTYLCDGAYYNNAITAVPSRGGYCNSGLIGGAFACVVNVPASYAYWTIGAALSCKPLA